MGKINKYDVKRYEREYLNQKQLIEQGRWKFALTQGSIWGIIVFIITTLISLKDVSFNEAFLSTNTLIYFLLYLISGILLYSTVMWYINKTAYKKSIKKLEQAKNEYTEQTI